MGSTELFLESCERVLPLLRSPELSERWSQPSSLDGWSNNGLAGHLARAAFNLERSLDRGLATAATDVAIDDVVSYYAQSEPDPADSPIGQRIRELGDQEAATGPAVLATRFGTSLTRLQQTGADPGAPITMFGRTLTVDDCAIACLLELVVHADDLAVGIGVVTLHSASPRPTWSWSLSAGSRGAGTATKR